MRFGQPEVSEIKKNTGFLVKSFKQIVKVGKLNKFYDKFIQNF